MKKLISLFLTLLIVFALCGCDANINLATQDEPSSIDSSPEQEESPSEESIRESAEYRQEDINVTLDPNVTVTPVETEDVEESPEETYVEEESEEYIVYRTKTGTKYHRDGCIHLKSKYELTLEEAESRGLTPCAVCQP